MSVASLCDLHLQCPFLFAQFLFVHDLMFWTKVSAVQMHRRSDGEHPVNDTALLMHLLY